MDHAEDDGVASAYLQRRRRESGLIEPAAQIGEGDGRCKQLRVLVGLALATFMTSGPLLWVYVVLGAAVSVVATLGTANALRPLGVAALWPVVPVMVTA